MVWDTHTQATGQQHPTEVSGTGTGARHRRPVSPQRCRDATDIAPSGPGTGPGTAVGAVRRRFSGSPLLPPLGCRLAEGARGPEPEGTRVVFTIEESGPSSGDESEPPR